MKRAVIFSVVAAGALAWAVAGGRAAGQPACDPNNAGLTLPQGFCAAVVAENLGTPRHLAVAPNGDLYVALQAGRGGGGGGVVGLRDSDGDGKFETREKFSDLNTTGIGLRNGYVYVATPTSVVRFKMTQGQLKPSGAAETVVDGLEAMRQHEDKGLTFDGKGSLYVNIGSPSNACQVKDRTPASPGQDPCPILERHGGIWKFDENRLGQKQDDGKKYATGMRQEPGITWHDGALYIVMHGRDQLNTMWPALYTTEQNAELPAETFYRVDEGANLGWPYCYYDWMKEKLLLNPEYGGDGNKTGRCDMMTKPLMGFPGHWAPNDLMFYSGSSFPQKYRGGVFIAFHGSWNRAPLPQAGYNVTFVPFSGGKVTGKYEVFANGFAGDKPLVRGVQAQNRPNGLAQAPDGSLYVASDEGGGKVWRIMYKK